MLLIYQPLSLVIYPVSQLSLMMSSNPSASLRFLTSMPNTYSPFCTTLESSLGITVGYVSTGSSAHREVPRPLGDVDLRISRPVEFHFRVLGDAATPLFILPGPIAVAV